jgi:hypothetical protein
MRPQAAPAPAPGLSLFLWLITVHAERDQFARFASHRRKRSQISAKVTYFT